MNILVWTPHVGSLSIIFLLLGILLYVIVRAYDGTGREWCNKIEPVALVFMILLSPIFGALWVAGSIIKKLV